MLFGSGRAVHSPGSKFGAEVPIIGIGSDFPHCKLSDNQRRRTKTVLRWRIVSNVSAELYKGSLYIIATQMLALPLVAQPQTDRDQPGPWKRHVMTPKGGWFDTPTPHPLAYFTRYPALLDESGDFCYLCTPQKKLSAAMAAKEPKAEVRLVGTIKGLTIYDVFYRFESDGAVDWKSILIKTAPNVYREILHCEPTHVDARALPSVITQLGTELLLNSRYFAGGNKGMYVDDYYSFDQIGPTLVDFAPILAAGRAVLPKGVMLWGGGDSNSPKTLTLMRFKLQVWNDGDGLCCRPGIVEVTFKLDRGHVVVTGAHYNPN